MDFIIPKTCHCGEFISSESNSSICPDCWVSLDFINQASACHSCGYPVGSSLSHLSSGNILCASCIQKKPKFNNAISVLKYNDEVAKLISSFKYYDKTSYHTFLSDLLINAINRKDWKFDYIIPVPISRARMFSRKYNQSILLSKKLSKQKQIEILTNAVFRVKNIPQQAGLSRDKRLKNIKNAFQTNSKFEPKILNKSVLIIDDVYTTGATVNEISKVLRSSGVKQIYVLTVARTIL